MVELLVALAVAGLVVLAAYGVVGFASDATARVRDDRRDALAGLHARAALHGWLRDAALVDGAGPFLARHIGTSERPLDELSFGVTDAGPGFPGPHRVRLSIGRWGIAPTPGLLAEFAPIRRGAPAEPETLVVAPGAVVGLRLRYLRREGTSERWVDEWDSDRSLPIAIELRVVDRAGTSARPSPGEARPPALLGLPVRVRLRGEAE